MLTPARFLPKPLFSAKIAILAIWIIASATFGASGDEGRPDSEAANVSKIIKLGGDVTRDKSREGKPVVMIDLNGPTIDDNALLHLIVFKELQRLNLQGTNISDAGLKTIAKFGKLTMLGLGNTNVTDDGLRNLKQLRSLEDLELGGTKINGEGLEELKEMKKLTSLSLVGIRPQKGSFKGVSKLVNLEFLDLHDAKINDRDLTQLEGLSKLKKLILTKTNVTSEGVEMLRKHLPKAEIVVDE